ncbi:MAG: M4 family metallopeptidase [Verrucomicrobia bacterium]|nr:M4 family metallopeptidase [Verrucomicrobiota bacterium]
MSRSISRDKIIAAVMGLVLVSCTAALGIDRHAESEGHFLFVSPDSSAVQQIPFTTVVARAEIARGFTGLSVRWHADRGVPSSISGEDLLASVGDAPGATPSSDAITLLTELEELYGIQDANQEFEVERVSVSSDGCHHVRLRQLHQAVRVAGASLIVHFGADGKARRVNGRYRPIQNVPSIPRLTPDQITQIAQKNLAAIGLGGGVLAKAPALCVWASAPTPFLAYELTISRAAAGGMPEKWRYVIDALTGEVRVRFNDIKHVDPPSEFSGTPATISGEVLAGEGGAVTAIAGWRENTSVHYLTSFSNLWQVLNAGSEVIYSDGDTYAFRPTSDWGASDPVEMSAAVNVNSVQTYFRDIHGRDSYDDFGTMIPALVHFGVSYVNAFWDGESMVFGDGDGIAANSLAVLDITGHELSHAVTEYSANLIYAYESGALNESFSDIFGALIEFYAQPDGRANYPDAVPGTADWLMGEDTWLESTALRDMRNPGSTETLSEGSQQPSRYLGTDWFEGAGDNGGVHFNSGVQNFFFYLLVEGGAGDNDGLAYDIDGVGLSAAEQIAYLTLTEYLFPSAEYADVAEAWIAAAEELDEQGVTTNASFAAIEAWAACGVLELGICTPPEGFSAGLDLNSYELFPTSKVYTLTNPTDTNLYWGITTADPWVTVSETGILQAAFTMTNVTVGLDYDIITNFPAGLYTSEVVFANDVLDTRTFERPVVVRVGENYRFQSGVMDWVDPSAGGHVLIVHVPNEDAITIPTAFDLSYYGETFTNLHVAREGLIGLLPEPSRGVENEDLPSLLMPDALICPYWDDLASHHLPGAVYYGVVGSPPNRAMVISWLTVPHAADSSERFSFQVLIHEAVTNEENDITFQYLDCRQDNAAIGGGRSATIGLEDQGGVMARRVSFNGQVPIANDDAIHFSTSLAPDVVDPTGRFAVHQYAQGSVTFELRFNEFVRGLELSDFTLTGSAPGATIQSVSHGGSRYLVDVGGISGLGSVIISVNASAVTDFSGNPNPAVGPFIFVVPLVQSVFFDDMEQGVGDWLAQEEDVTEIISSGWEWGPPTGIGGPTSAYSGASCWGVYLGDGGTYSNFANTWLQAPPLHVGDDPSVEFRLWKDTEAGYDFLYVEVSKGQGWDRVAAFSGYSGAWQLIQLELDEDTYANETIYVRFRLVADASLSFFHGAYVDDFAIQSRRADGLWVQAYLPLNAAPSTINPIGFTLYNTSTQTFPDVQAHVSTLNTGASVPGLDTIDYGDLLAGALTNGSGTVNLSLADASQFVGPTVFLVYSVTSSAGYAATQFLPFEVIGIPFTVGAHVLRARSSGSVSDWQGEPLQGNGGVGSAVFQLIGAGSNGSPDPPRADGGVTGDDALLYSVSPLSAIGRFGEGAGIPEDEGQFSKIFHHNLGSGSKVFVRAWDGASFLGSVAYGDSSRFTLTGESLLEHDFGSWNVINPTDDLRDTNGDGVPDSYYIAAGQNPFASGGLSLVWAPSPGSSVVSGLSRPGRVAATATHVYIADTRHDRVLVASLSLDTIIQSYGSFGTGDGQFAWPEGLTYDPASGRLYVADTKNDRVVALNISGSGLLSFNFAFNGTASPVGALNTPYDVATDSSGNIYVTDTDNNQIQKFNKLGEYLDSAGGYYKPSGIAVDSADRVIVADTDHHQVKVLDTDLDSIITFGSLGTAIGELQRPIGIGIGIGDRIYVVEQVNHRIQIFSAAPTPTSLGAYKPPSGAHGGGDDELRLPQGAWPVLTGDRHLVYVADSWNDRVKCMELITDGDQDGMEDLWEDRNGLDSTIDDSLLDKDLDGVSNVGEYRFGSDPDNPTSFPFSTDGGNEQFFVRAVALGAGGSGHAAEGSRGVVFSFDASESGIYEIQHCDDIAGGAWNAGTLVYADADGVITVTNSVPNSSRFFRVRWLNP